MRILHLIKSLDRGGAEVLLVELAALQAEAGHQVSIAICDPVRTGLAGAVQSPVAVHLLREGRWLLGVGRLVRSLRPNIVHIHSPRTAALARPLLLALRAVRPTFRIVYTEHNLWPLYHPVTRWANRVTFWANDEVVAVSEAVKRSISSRVPLTVVVHGRDRRHLLRDIQERPVNRSALIDGDGLLVVHVANHRPEKDHRTALLAIRTSVDAGTELAYVSVGDGSLRTASEALVEDLDLGGVVRFVGQVANAPSYMAIADVVMLSSRFEGLPVVIMEALMLGVPVVSTDVGGVSELVRHSINGLLVAPGDPGALGAALTRIMRDAELRQGLRNGGKLSGSQIDLNIAATRIEELYRG